MLFLSSLRNLSGRNERDVNSPRCLGIRGLNIVLARMRLVTHRVLTLCPPHVRHAVAVWLHWGERLGNRANLFLRRGFDPVHISLVPVR